MNGSSSAKKARLESEGPETAATVDSCVISSNTDFMERSCGDAYAEAHEDFPLDLDQLFPKDLADFIRMEAKKKESPPELLSVLLLDLVSYMLSPATGFSPDKNLTYEIPCNIYLLGICPPGTGKSQIFKMMVDGPAYALEAKWKFKGEQRICLKKATPAAVTNALAKSKGRLLFINDEMCHLMEQLLDKKTPSVHETRMSLNHLWTGGSYRKDFASKKALEIKQTYFSIGGTTHPGYIGNVLQMLSGPDGLIDRFFFLTCSPYKNAPLAQDFDHARYSKIPQGDEWPVVLYDGIDLVHNTGRSEKPRRVYYPEDTGADDLKDLKEEHRDNMENRHRRYAEIRKAKRASDQDPDKPCSTSSLSDTIMRLMDVPVASGDTKDNDMTAKEAVVLHVIEHSFAELMETGECGKRDIPLQISQATVKRAIYLTGLLRTHVDLYLEALKTFNEIKVAVKIPRVVSPSADLSSSGPNSAWKSLTMEQQLALYPGKYLTSQMFTRRGANRKTSAHLLNSLMEKLSKDPNTDGFFGQYRKIRNRHCFFKAPWERVDQSFVKDTLVVSEKDYKSAYAHSGPVPSVSGFNQVETLKFLEANKPDFCV